MLQKYKQDKNSFKYDCLSYYKHGDDSYEWLPCRIVYREPRCNEKGLTKSLVRRDEIPFQTMMFIYWIEFKHNNLFEQSIYQKRNAQEILFSKEYQINFNKGFVQDSVSYLLQLYS